MKPPPDPAVRAGDPLSRTSPSDAYSAARRARRRASRAGRAGTDSTASQPPVVVTARRPAAAPHARRGHRRWLGGTIPSTSRRRIARRTADAAVRSAKGALLPSADASFGTRYQQGGQQVFNGLSFSNSSDAIQSSYGLNLNYRVNSATFVNPKAAAREPRRGRCGHHRLERAASRGGDAAVPERAPGAGALGAAGHAGEDGRRPSSSSRRPSSRSVRERRSTSAAPRWRSARRRWRCLTRAQQRRGREASPLPAARRRAAGERAADDRLPGEPADLLARLAARSGAAAEPGDPRAPLARAGGGAEREGRARRRTRRRST